MSSKTRPDNMLAWTGVSSLALFASSPCVAQTAAPPTAQPEGAPQLGEIVVTAQRRNEREQDVPIAINTVSADTALKLGVSSTTSLGVAVPALQFNRQAGQGGTPFIRGVGTVSTTVNVESPIAVYVDDVYLGGGGSTIFGFNNIASIEVLKGPQGTLFGRNATGGVIHVHTRAPSPETAIDGTIGYSSFDTYNGALYVNGAVAKDLSANIAVTGSDQTNGYGHNLKGQDIYKSKDIGVRTQALWEPSLRTSLRLAADFYKGRGDIGENQTIAPGTVGLGGATSPGRYRSTSDPVDTSTNTLYGVSAKLQQDIGDLKLVSVTAYRKTKVSYTLDNDGSLPGAPQILTVAPTQRRTDYSQELQIRSPDRGRFQWIVGAFYYRAKSVYFLRTSGLAFAALGGFADTNSEQTLNSYSGFADANYALSSRTKFTAGLRYTVDHFDTRALLTTATGAIRAPGSIQQSARFPKLTYRAVLDHKLTNDVLLYASYSRGFRSGGFNLASPAVTISGVGKPAPPVKPEVVDAAEAGFKSEWFHHTLRVNASGFYYNYSNLQLVTLVGPGVSATLNAAKAHMKGVDVDVAYAPTRRFTIKGGASLLDAKFASFPNGPVNVPNPATCAPVPHTTGPLTGGNTQCFADLRGNNTPDSPRLTFSVSATYVVPADPGDIAFDVSLYHNSGFFWEVDNRFRQPEHDLLDASVSWTSSNKHYSVRAYARNLLNAYYFTYFSEGATRDAGSPQMPRNYGVSFGFNF